MVIFEFNKIENSIVDMQQALNLLSEALPEGVVREHIELSDLEKNGKFTLTISGSKSRNNGIITEHTAIIPVFLS